MNGLIAGILLFLAASTAAAQCYTQDDLSDLLKETYKEAPIMYGWTTNRGSLMQFYGSLENSWTLIATKNPCPEGEKCSCVVMSGEDLTVVPDNIEGMFRDVFENNTW